MNEVQAKLEALRQKGWTYAAIADELGVSNISVFRWKKGDRYPENTKAVLAVMDNLMKRRRIPKRKRYTKNMGTHSI